MSKPISLLENYSDEEKIAIFYEIGQELMEELFIKNCKPIDEFPRYYISKYGNVWDTELHKEINRLVRDRTGEIYVYLTNTIRATIARRVAVLVYSAYVKYVEPPTKFDYLDNDPTNTYYLNLRPIGSNFYNFSHKLTENDLKQFKIIPSFPDYMINEYGVVYSLLRNQIIRSDLSDKGYFQVSLINNDKKRKTVFVHRCVYEAWIGPLDPSKTIDHLDFNPQNNYWGNLEQVTQTENTQRARIKAEYSPWKIDDIHIICKGLEDKKSKYEILHELKLEPTLENKRRLGSIITVILRREYWNQVSALYNIPKVGEVGAFPSINNKLTKEDAIEIKRRLSNGEGNSSIARDYKVSDQSIKNIKVGISYKWV